VQIAVESFDGSSFHVVADDDGAPVGYVFVHDLPRRECGRRFLVYDVDVNVTHRRRGIATALLETVARLARDRGIVEGSLLTERDDDGANALYAKVGGLRSDVVMWDFEYGTADGR
jgi:aminoglycoside 3-N-acetyltransferase I